MTPTPPPFVALLLAAGRSTRIGGPVPKPYLRIRDRTVLVWSAERLARLPGHQGTVLVVDPAALEERIPELRTSLESSGVSWIGAGGETRQESCRKAYETAKQELDFELLAVHDSARPFFPLSQTEEALRIADRAGGAILGHFARDTLKRVDPEGRVTGTVERSEIFQAATPQCFRRERFEEMLRFAEDHGITGSDEASLAEVAGVPVQVVDCPGTNLKITHPWDLPLVRGLEALLEEGEDA